MAIKYLKKAIKTPSTDDLKTRSTVQNILNDIEKRKEEGIWGGLWSFIETEKKAELELALSRNFDSNISNIKKLKKVIKN